MQIMKNLPLQKAFEDITKDISRQQLFTTGKRIDGRLSGRNKKHHMQCRYTAQNSWFRSFYKGRDPGACGYNFWYLRRRTED